MLSYGSTVYVRITCVRLYHHIRTMHGCHIVAAADILSVISFGTDFAKRNVVVCFR